MTADLTLVDQVTNQLANGDLTLRQAVHTLKAHGLVPSGFALGNATAALILRDRFLHKDGDPYEWLGIGPAFNRDAFAIAVERCEADYAEACAQLATRATPALRVVTP